MALSTGEVHRAYGSSVILSNGKWRSKSGLLADSQDCRLLSFRRLGDHRLRDTGEEPAFLTPTHIIWSANMSSRSQRFPSSWCAVLFLGFSSRSRAPGRRTAPPREGPFTSRTALSRDCAVALLTRNASPHKHSSFQCTSARCGRRIPKRSC